MKKLEDYLPLKPRRKTPTKLSESPILSPDTTKALENAERLMNEAQKKIIEASYDIDSSPEREKSIGSVREREAEDEDALYIRDIVSTRFHEANESARIFTRPSARPLAERLCRPEVRRGRARRLAEGSYKTRIEQSTIRRSNPLRSTSRAIDKNFNPTRLRNSFRPRRAPHDDETPSEILNAQPTTTSASRSPGKVADRTSLNSLKVQEGPRVDIRNELTVTDVENVDITPKPRSSLPVRLNTKTYEFRHESCVKDVVADAPPTSDEARSTETGVSGTNRRSPEVAEESADPLRPASARQGSRSDLVANKSGRSIRPEPLEGRADDARISIRDATVHEGNPPESFIDFLRRATSDEAENLCDDAQKAEALRNKVLVSLNTKEKIDIFDRAIDEFFEEFKRAEAPKRNFSRSPPRRGDEVRLAEGDFVDGDRVDDEKFDDFAIEALETLGDEPEVFGVDWNAEDIKLEPPNFGDLEKTVRRFDSTIEKIFLGTRNLEVLMSRYCIEAERPDVAFTDRERTNNPSCTTATKEIPNREQKRTGHVRGKKAPRCEDYKTPISDDEDLSGSSGESRGIFTAKSGRNFSTSREAKLGWREKKIPSESRLRFSTPLDGSRIIASSRRANGANVDFETDDCGRFFIDIERPKCVLENRRITVDEETTVSSGARRNEPEENSSRRKKIVPDRIDRNCNFDKVFDRDREENSPETATFPTYTNRERRVSSDRRNSGRSLVQDSAIGRTTDQSEKIFLGTKLIDERVAGKDSSRSERSAPVMKNYEKSASPSTKALTVKNRSVDVASIARVGEIGEGKKLTDDGTKKQRSKGEEMSEKNRLAESAGSSPRDRTSLDVSTVYSDDFEEPVISSGKSKSEGKIASRMNDGEMSVFEEKKSSAIMDREGEVEYCKNVLKASCDKVESTKSDGENSIFYEKKSSATMDVADAEVEDGSKTGRNSILKEKKSSTMMADRDENVLKIIGEKLESTKSDGQNEIYNEKKSSAMMNDRDGEVEGVAKSGQNLISIEKKSSAIMNDRDKGVENGKTVLKRTEEKLESVNNDERNSIFIEKKSSARVNDRDEEVEDFKTVLKKAEENLESTNSDRQNSIAKEKKSSPPMEVEDGKIVRSPPESSEWPSGESREETKYPEKSFSVSVNESSDRNKDDDERRLSEVEGSEENNSVKKEADPDSGEVSEKSSGYRASVLSSSGSIKASGMSSLLRDSHRKGIKGSEESNGVEAPEDFVLGKKSIACSRNFCEGAIGRCNCKEYTNCPALDIIEVLEESNSIGAVESGAGNSFPYDEEEEEIEQAITEPELKAPKSNCLKEAFTEFRQICPFANEEDSPSNFEVLRPEDDVKKENIHDSRKGEDRKDPEKSSRINKIVDLENEAKKSSRNFRENSDRSDFESCMNSERIGGFESSAIIHSTPKQFIANSGRTMESLVLPFPDPIPDDDHMERAADACSENYSEGELYLPSSCSYSLGEIRISERPSYGTVGTGIESSTRNSDGIRIFFTKSYATLGSSDHTINAPNTAVQSPGEVQETDVESIGSSRGLSSSGEHRQGS